MSRAAVSGTPEEVRRDLGPPLAVTPIRLLVAAAHELTRLGLAAMAEGQADLVVAAEVDDPRALGAAFARERPDVVLIDFDAPGYRDAAAQLLAEQPGAVVMALGSHEGDQEIRRALEVGVRGYLPKSLPAREIASGLRGGRQRKLTLPRSVMQTLAERADEPRLTAREHEVLGLLAEGRNNASIAAMLEIATGTVKVHIKAILAKLGAGDRTEATAIAFRRGFVRLQ